jgi:UDP-N-acetylmuramoylalanine--D-glutamate ligase
VENVLAAVAVACAAGLEFEAVAQAVRAFTPVPHRLEPVASAGGISYYNDSIATTPERALAGLRSFEAPVVLLLGGREKNLPLDELARAAVRRCRAVVCFGEAGPLLQEALRAAAGEVANGGAAATERVATLADAVKAARRLARPGDVVLLSPACTSYDAYDNFEERGEDFRRLVRRSAARGGTPPSRSHKRAV